MLACCTRVLGVERALPGRDRPNPSSGVAGSAWRHADVPSSAVGRVDAPRGGRQPRRVTCVRIVAVAFALASTFAHGVAHAQQELATIAAVHGACERARERTAPRLYVIRVEYALGRFDEEEGRLHVDTRRNLRALDGHVSLLLSGLEPIAFDADADAARALREAARSGAVLRVGFFLGFDDARRQSCVVRGPHAVTIVRADLAFAELVTANGERLARTETDRLRAWLEDRAALAVPGEGPRGAVGTATFDDGRPPPEAWQRALDTEPVRSRFARCHAEGVERGAESEAHVVVRLNVETRTGRIRRADVALSSLGDADEARCIASALGAVRLPPAPASWQADVVDLSVPVRLAADGARARR